MPAKAPLPLLLLTMLFTACADQGREGTPWQTPGPLLLSQAGLDAVTGVPAANLDAITGDPFGARSGEPATVAEVMRQITANRRVEEPVTVGSVYTLRSFYYQNGQRGALKHVDVMIKREAGYNPLAADFEFIRIMADSATDYTLHPNGRLPDTTLTTVRGRDLVAGNTTCRSCHAATAAGGDFLFHK